MGRASTYFYDSNNSDKQTLHRRIRPSDTQFEEQQGRWNALSDYLLPRLNEASGYSIKSWLQGSYKFGTQIRPVQQGGEFDVDLGVYYCWKGCAEDGEIGPRDLKSFVQKALEDFMEDNDDVKEVCNPPKPRCGRIRFEGSFHIDVPCYHLDEAADQRALATERNVWEYSDPKALYKWFTAEFEPSVRDRARRHIRYLKTWAALKLDGNGSLPSSSVLITTLVANAISELKDGLPSSEDEAFAEVVRAVLDAVSDSQDVRNPVDENENFAARMDSDDWSDFVKGLKSLKLIADAALACDTEVEACSAWAIAFEYLFPLPEEQLNEEQEQGLPAIRTMPEVTVIAISLDNRKLRYRGVNSIGPIPKNCEITFSVTNVMQLPHGTRFSWIVRNDGDEAENENDLGHIAGIGTNVKEHSAYNGTHYMDCTAIIGNRIVGVRRVNNVLYRRVTSKDLLP
jgi:hypothetical protein